MTRKNLTDLSTCIAERQFKSIPVQIKIIHAAGMHVRYLISVSSFLPFLFLKEEKRVKCRTLFNGI